MRRRDFLGAGAAFALIGGAARALPTIPSRPDADASDALTWIAFRDGRYRLSIPRAEIGQNISTGLKRIACAELGVDWEAIDVIYADTTSIAPYRATVGSESIQDFALPLAQACAALRRAVAEGRTGRIDVADIPREQLRAFAPIAEYPRKKLVSGREIVTGAPLFASDVRLPNMVFGRVLRASTSPELSSRPSDWDDAAARAIPGFVALVQADGLDMNYSEGLGIVARTPGALDRIEDALAVEWTAENAPKDDAIDAALDIDRRIDDGGADYDIADDRIDRDTAWDVDLRIDTPVAAHAPIEPRVAMADIGKDGGRIWVGSQDPFFVRDTLVDRLDLDEDETVVIPQRTGGGFGGKAIPLVEIEAAALSQAVGRPVKVQWTRAQELTHGYHRPATSHRVKARIKNGRISEWSHRFASGHVIFSNAVLPKWMQTFTDFIGDDGAARNATPPYRIDALEIGYDLERLPIRTGAWRGLGAGPNMLAIEMAMERCATAAGVDPVQFRLNHIDDPRLANVLKAAAKQAGPPPAAGRGVGCGVYKGVSYGAVIADAALRPDGTPFVKRLYAAHDCGWMADPDQVRAQCEGNLIWSLGMVLTDRLTLAEGGVAERDFFDAPIPRITDAPPMEITLIRSEEPPVGAGETLMASTPAAIANAIADLTGAAATRLPLGA